MTDKQFKKIANDLQIWSTVLVSSYPADADIITAYLSTMDFNVDPETNALGYIDSLTAYAESKEHFEICSELFKIKKQITNE